jgi:methenyltetrahydromethanopterin cyclohydrolase
MQLTAVVQSATRVCERSISEASQLGISLHLIGGAQVLDFAVKRPGTIAGGIRLAEICMAGLANVDLQTGANNDLNLPAVVVATDWPLCACIASQYAGWPFSHGSYFAMCSGTARMNRGREEILDQYQLTGQFSPAIGIFESNSLPTEVQIREFAAECNVALEQVILCIARTASFPGAIQVVARSVETALHKLHELKFDLKTIRSAIGTAPLPPIPPDDLTALGWANDAILYGGCVQLWVDTTDDAIGSVLESLPSKSSPDFGDPFLETFNRYQRDFYKIDKLLFCPAKVVFNNLATGRSFRCGEIRFDILKKSFGI